MNKESSASDLTAAAAPTSKLGRGMAAEEGRQSAAAGAELGIDTWPFMVFGVVRPVKTLLVRSVVCVSLSK